MLFRRPNRSRKPRRPVQSFTLPARWNARPRLEALDERLVPAFFDAVNYAVGTYPNAVVTGDFNNDTVQDLAFANRGNQTVSVLLGNADGTFDPARSSPSGNSPTSLAVGDFNDDGNLDLVTGDPSYGTTVDVTVLLGKGDGTFQTPAVIDLMYSGYNRVYSLDSVAAGDFNADGLLDICATGYYGWAEGGYSGVYADVTVLLGTGSGTFGASLRSGGGDGFLGSAAVVDVNEDGVLDIATTTDYGYGNVSVNVALGDGSGYFGSPSYYGGFGNSLIATDLNDDGNVDLASANYTGSVAVLFGTGSGTFGSPQSYAAGSYPSSLAAADFNDDGAIDLITTNADTATVSVLLGTGTGAFKPPLSAAVGSTPWGVVVGDFDGDGLMDAASANNSSHDVSILINDGNWPALNSPSISINDVTVTEGNTGTVNATFTVSLSAVSSQTVTIHYATADGSATTAGGDYQAVEGTLTFVPGDMTKTFTVPVNGDRVVEFTESFVIVLTDATNAFVADARGAGTITDDEPRASIDYGPVYVTEGNTGTTAALFTVRLSSAYDAPVSVNYATSNGGATAGSDYEAVNTSVTFAPGETVKTFPVTIYGDRVAEYGEGFYVNLVGASGYAYGVIQDDEPRISISDVTKAEGKNRRTTFFVFTVTLSTPYDQPVTMSFATANGTATTSNSDYVAKTGTLTFAPGETTKTITIEVKGDNRREANETFYLDLFGNSGNSLFTKSRGIVSILNDD